MILQPDVFNGEPVPLVYDLQYSTEQGAFFLSLPEAVLTGLVIGRYEELVKKEWSSLTGFVNDNGHLGFGGCFEACSPRWAFYGCRSFRCGLQPCIGTDNDRDRDPAKRLHATLSVLFSALEYTEAQPNNCDVRQQARCSMLCKCGMNGASTWITLSPQVREWTLAHEEFAVKQARLAMLDVSRRMWPGYFAELEDMAIRQHRVWINSGALFLEVPGNATSLCTDWGELQDGRGWKLDSHNCDCDVQGLALLAGVCRLVYLSRRTSTKESDQPPTLEESCRE